MHSSVCGEASTLERLGRHGLGTDVLARRRGRLGPILAARANVLEERGLLTAGEHQEELLVIRAR